VPVIYHMISYRQFDVDRFLFRTKEYAMIGIICIMLAMYLGLGLALNSRIPVQIAYSLAFVSFHLYFLSILRHTHA
jgi:hypothetical protein